MKPPNIMCASCSVCSLIARVRVGWLYPWIAHHQELIPSISSLPSSSVITHPLAEGIWVRPFGRLVYLEPQFMAITDEQLESLIGGLTRVLRACYR